jgi:methionyl-tRNA formyltransferase
MARIVFMGTPDFAVPSLSALITHHEVVGVVTQPDRPAGRKAVLTPPPVKLLALQHHIPIIQPEKLRQPEAVAWLEAANADIFVVAAFGQLLPQRVLDIPGRGCINVHGSLLPRWRGAAPIQAAIRAGDAETGITLMLMDAGLDTGPVLAKRSIPIGRTDTAEVLYPRLAALGAALLVETLPAYLAGQITPQPQNENEVTYAPQISKLDGAINWQEPALSIERLIRAYTPWPGTYTVWEGRKIRITDAVAAEGYADPGTIVRSDKNVAVGCGEGILILHEVQPEGRKRMKALEFVNGYPAFVGASL